MKRRDVEIVAVTGQIDALLEELDATVTALNDMLATSSGPNSEEPVG